MDPAGSRQIADACDLALKWAYLWSMPIEVKRYLKHQRPEDRMPAFDRAMQMHSMIHGDMQLETRCKTQEDGRVLCTAECLACTLAAVCCSTSVGAARVLNNRLERWLDWMEQLASHERD